MQYTIAIGLLVAAGMFGFLAARGRGVAELWGALAILALLVDTFVVQRARVLTIPFFFVLVIILLFWSARRHAERLDAEEKR